MLKGLGNALCGLVGGGGRWLSTPRPFPVLVGVGDEQSDTGYLPLTGEALYAGCVHYRELAED